MVHLDKNFLWKLGLSLIIAGQSMVWSLSVNLSELSSFDSVYWALHGLLLCSSLIVCLLLGLPLLQETYDALKQGEITVEAMFLLSALGAMVASVLSSIRGQGPVFYEVVCIVLCIYSIGKTIGQKAKSKVLTAVDEFKKNISKVKILTKNGSTHLVELHETTVGMLAVLEPGDMAAVDGDVVAGQSFITQTHLTGEPLPIACGIGSRILAGSYVMDGRLEVEIKAAAGHRFLDQILDSICSTPITPSRSLKRSRAIMQAFVPAVACLSLSTFLIWQGYVGWQQALLHSMSVLLVACPCAFGLALPIAFWSALWNLAQVGILVKNGDFFDILSRTNSWIFDKTGTLTHLDLMINKWSIDPSSPYAQTTVQSLVHQLQYGLNHPISQAFTHNWQSCPDMTVQNRQWVAGCGVVGEIAYKDQLYSIRIGHSGWIAYPHKQAVNQPSSKRLEIEINGYWVGYVLLKEIIKPDTLDTLTALTQLTPEIAILSSDPSSAWHQLGSIPIQSPLSPFEKADYVKKCKKNNRTVIFVGDGINDTAAMAAADACIVIATSSDLVQSHADAILTHGSIKPILKAYSIARATMQTVWSNQLLALGYNILGISLACAGYLHPVLAALIMAASSATVSIRALYATRLK